MRIFYSLANKAKRTCAQINYYQDQSQNKWGKKLKQIETKLKQIETKLKQMEIKL